MRQVVGEKKLRKLREKTGLPIVRATVRGGTNHRIDLYLEDGSMAFLYFDGSMELNTLQRWKEPVNGTV